MSLFHHLVSRFRSRETSREEGEGDDFLARLTVDIDGPDCAVVTLVRAQSFTVVGEPDVDNVILGRGKDEVSLGVVLDLCRSLSQRHHAAQEERDERVRERS